MRRHNNCIRVVLCLSVLVLAVFDLSCNESLPPHEDPKSLFQGTLKAEYHPGVVYGGSQLWIYLYVINTFDETLQNYGMMKGTLDIVLSRDPNYHRSVSLDWANLVNGVTTDPRTGQIVVNREDTVTLLYKWDFVDDNGVWLPSTVFRGFEKVIISGTFQVFDKTGLVDFNRIYYDFSYH